MLWLFHINSFIQCGVFIYDRMLVIRQATQSGDVAACRIYRVVKPPFWVVILSFWVVTVSREPKRKYWSMSN